MLHGRMGASSSPAARRHLNLRLRGLALHPMEGTVAFMGKVPEALRKAVSAAGFSEVLPASADVVLCVGTPATREREELKKAQEEGRCAVVAAGADEAEELAKEFPVAVLPLAGHELCSLLGGLAELSRLKRERGRPEMQRLIELRDELLSVAWHDLRTPVTSLKLLADLLETGIPEFEGKTLGGFPPGEFVETMRRNLSRVEEIISGILDISRLYRDASELDLAPVDVNEVVGEVAASLFPMAMGKDIVLDAELAPDLPVISADSARVSQLVINLIDNALKYTSPGGTVTVKTSGADGGGGVVIEVADTGPGSPEEEQVGIFERVGRGSSRATGGEARTGRGLYICKEIMELHGGRIWLESKPGEGSRFLAFFPKGEGDDS